jgi:hypothetical protein
MKRWLSLAISILALAVAPATVMAGQDSAHFGPISSGSTDSSTCGGDWANDTFKRVFDVPTTPNADGSYSGTESFIAGHFVTIAGASPGACESGSNNGSMIEAGVTGSFHGSFGLIVRNGTFNSDASCDESICNSTAKFVAIVFGAAATFDTGPSFVFTYHANGPDLVQRMWQNASTDEGGNSGDIRTS